MMRHVLLSLCLSVPLVIEGDVTAEDEPFRPTRGEFAPIEKSRAYRGELVFVDHVNRRGSLRLHVDGHYHEGKLHHFAMLPYGVIRYRGAPAELRDIPIGTVLHGRFFLPPDPNTSAVPVISGKKNDPTQPPENYALLLEDGLSLCLREGKTWQLKEVEIKASESHLVASLDRKSGAEGEGFGGEHTVTIDESTRIWRGRELLGMDDLVADGTWPEGGKKSFDGTPIQLGLTWHPRYLYQQFHAADIWLDEEAIEVAADRQRGRHLRHIRMRWMPARVDSVDHGEFGEATVTVTLFGGMDESLYADFKADVGAQVAVAEDTLRTYWPNHDGMDGKIVAVERPDAKELPFGSSGIRVQWRVPLVLEGFRPGRIVRIRPHSWPKVKPPYEELIKGIDARWPSADIFP